MDTTVNSIQKDLVDVFKESKVSVSDKKSIETLSQ